MKLQISSGNTEEVVDRVLDGTIAIGLIEGPAMRKDVRVEPFMEDELVLLYPANHPWKNRELLTRDDLKGVPAARARLGNSQGAGDSPGKRWAEDEVHGRGNGIGLN